MEVWEYNYWIGYLLLEQDEQKEQMEKSKYR